MGKQQVILPEVLKVGRTNPDFVMVITNFICAVWRETGDIRLAGCYPFPSSKESNLHGWTTEGDSLTRYGVQNHLQNLAEKVFISFLNILVLCRTHQMSTYINSDNYIGKMCSMGNGEQIQVTSVSKSSFYII